MIKNIKMSECKKHKNYQLMAESYSCKIHVYYLLMYLGMIYPQISDKFSIKWISFGKNISPLFS